MRRNSGQVYMLLKMRVDAAMGNTSNCVYVPFKNEVRCSAKARLFACTFKNEGICSTQGG